jgi:hypothetical protein
MGMKNHIDIFDQLEYVAALEILDQHLHMEPIGIHGTGDIGDMTVGPKALVQQDAYFPSPVKYDVFPRAALQMLPAEPCHGITGVHNEEIMLMQVLPDFYHAAKVFEMGVVVVCSTL